MIRKIIPPFIHLETVKEGTVEYEALPDHFTFLKGNDGKDLPQDIFDEYQDSRAAFEMTSIFGRLKCAASQPDFATSYRETFNVVDICSIRDMLREIVDDMSSDYIDGSTILYLIHPPSIDRAVNRALSRLPLSPDTSTLIRRLVSIQSDGKNRAFQVEPYILDLSGRDSSETGWLFLHLFNPFTPTLVLTIPESGRLTSSDASLAIGHTSQVELRAMDIIKKELRSKGVEVEYSHEPNGPTSFPDFHAEINGTDWAIEVTRVLGGIPEGRTVYADVGDRESLIDQAIRHDPVQHAQVECALAKALEDKRSKGQDVKPGTKYCLVLVNPINLAIEGTSAIWNDRDLTDFDAVLLIQPGSELKVEYIKGSLLDASAA